MTLDLIALNLVNQNLQKGAVTKEQENFTRILFAIINKNKYKKTRIYRVFL